MLVVFSSVSYASSIASFQTDSSTGWSKPNNSNSKHMGTKYTTYKYSSSSVKTKYLGAVSGGISLWGNNISCTYSVSSGKGLITVSAGDIGQIAATRSYNDSNKHITTWEIKIYSELFDDYSMTAQKKIIAHEIGHVYGLTHFNNRNHIMYQSYQVTIGVTDQDIAGMNVMTHEHIHSGSYSRTYESCSDHSHKVRCTTCLAYYIDTCQYTDYHSGSRHYFVFSCICGNNQTLSWACSWNPCVQPF